MISLITTSTAINRRRSSGSARQGSSARGALMPLTARRRRPAASAAQSRFLRCFVETLRPDVLAMVRSSGGTALSIEQVATDSPRLYYQNLVAPVVSAHEKCFRRHGPHLPGPL